LEVAVHPEGIVLGAPLEEPEDGVMVLLLADVAEMLVVKDVQVVVVVVVLLALSTMALYHC
jgi:hypothetical protein